MNDIIERYPVEKKHMKGEDSRKPDRPDHEAAFNAVFERFPAEKQRIRAEDPAELIFFDVDDEGEEAEFIRVNDLFRLETGPGSGGSFFLTLFPRSAERVISGKISRLIRRTLYLSAAGLQCRISKVRVRPHFVQWLTEPGETNDPELLTREFRADLEFQMHSVTGLAQEERFWSESCFMWFADSQINDEKIDGMIGLYREK